MTVTDIAYTVMSASAINYDSGMARWEADSRGRLAQAAMELYAERGFENTTVAEIAQRAGVTERTFFRHFLDKRDVLFAGAEQFQALVIAGVTAAPPELGALDTAVAGMLAAAEQMEETPGRAAAAARRGIIEASSELQERELIKFAMLRVALGAALADRAVEHSDAMLAADLAIAVFRNAFTLWVNCAAQPFPSLVNSTLSELRELTVTP
jgi:AcrR family transcriptional regulator